MCYNRDAGVVLRLVVAETRICSVGPCNQALDCTRRHASAFGLHSAVVRLRREITAETHQQQMQTRTVTGSQSLAVEVAANSSAHLSVWSAIAGLLDKCHPLDIVYHAVIAEALRSEDQQQPDGSAGSDTSQQLYAEPSDRRRSTDGSRLLHLARTAAAFKVQLNDLTAISVRLLGVNSSGAVFCEISMPLYCPHCSAYTQELLQHEFFQQLFSVEGPSDADAQHYSIDSRLAFLCRSPKSFEAACAALFRFNPEQVSDVVSFPVTYMKAGPTSTVLPILEQRIAL